jgi:NDP-4-keto-2,6-dideoxyhexose 3-C-methyltransferase
MKCCNCKNKNLKKILTFGKQPISSVFPNKKINKLKKYPLDLFECNNCKLIQFSKLAPLNEMYGQTYGYRTSLSRLMVNHMRTKYLNIKKNKFIKNNSNILDIGSNDGTFLNFFLKDKVKANFFGMDPSANRFKEYYNKKINLITDYFSFKEISKNMNYKKTKKKFSLITSFAMFYDIENPNLFCKDINKLLDKNGLWVLELSYFPLLLKNLTYDQICHEHITYYTLTTFKNIISKNNLKIIDLSFNEINGGSVEITCAKIKSNHKPKEKKINKILLDEKKIDNHSYERLAKRINNTKNNIKYFLEWAGKNNVIGYGASTKGNIVLNQCNLNSNNIKYICDANPYKYNRFTPGSNIKIISKEKMRKIKPKYLFVLIWSFRKEVINQELDYIKNGGKLVFHLPMFHIIDKNNYKEYLNDDFKAFSFDY